jgi:putative spermidine/putrescine transport system permease protein
MNLVQGASGRRHLGALVLVLPMAVFLAVFFAWPLFSVLMEAVSDSAAAQTLPFTARELSGWDRKSPVSPAMQAALIRDLRALDDPQRGDSQGLGQQGLGQQGLGQQGLGDVVRRLNSARPGFRTLMNRTVAALRSESAPAGDLAAIDRRWGDIEWWRVIAETLAPYTDRNLLGALDLTRDESGAIVPMEADVSVNRTILARTFSVAAAVTVLCFAIGLPYAMLLASVGGGWRQALLAAVLLPLWTSILVRTAAWYILLQDRGLINEALMAIGVTREPLPLIFNRLGVVIAMTHVLLPFMVLPVYSVLVAIPQNLMRAAASLGANPLRAFWRVLLPLSLRGAASGALLVFMASIGYYITPALIGGPRDQMISSVIAFYAIGSANWGMAGALGIVLLVATLALYAVYWRLSDRTPVF